MFLSISDNDRCATCKLCQYDPGRSSSCVLDFERAVMDADSCVTDCPNYVEIAKPGDNIIGGIDRGYGGYPKVWR